MTSNFLALALAASLLPPASPLEGPQPARTRTPGVGRVLQATGARAYLDAGAEDGLSVGQPLTLWRGELELGRCAVDAVGPGTATCSGAVGARAGDAFKLVPTAPTEVKVVTLPPLPSEEEQARRAAAVAVAPVTLVAWKAVGPAAPALAQPRANVAEVALGDAVWTTSDLDSWDVARLDASFHGPLSERLTLDLDLRAERWVARSSTPTFRPKDETRLYLWQAQVGYGASDGSWLLSAGRVLPWTVPGASVMDGAIVGLRRPGLEYGAFGGLVPEPDTLNPGTTRATGGGYWILDRRFEGNVVLRQEGRLAWVRSPELGDRIELEADAGLHVGHALDLFGSARLAAGGTPTPPGGLDAARLEAGWRPVTGISITGGGEYGGLAVPWSVAPPAFGSRNRRADLSAAWELGPVRVAASGGLSRDAATGLDRTWFGPEVYLHRLFTPRVSLSAGYAEELGWLHGRSAWLQTVAKPWDPLRLIARVSWSHEASLAVDQEEVGLSLTAAAELTRRLGLRVSAVGRAGFSSSMGEGGAVPFGLTASAAVYALF